MNANRWHDSNQDFVKLTLGAIALGDILVELCSELGPFDEPNMDELGRLVAKVGSSQLLIIVQERGVYGCWC